jgi:hypothetical protein
VHTVVCPWGGQPWARSRNDCPQGVLAFYKLSIDSISSIESSPKIDRPWPTYPTGPGILKSRGGDDDDELPKEAKGTKGKRKRTSTAEEEEDDEVVEEEEGGEVVEEPEGVTIGKYSMRTSTSHVRKSSIFLSSYGSMSPPQKKSLSPKVDSTIRQTRDGYVFRREEAPL